MNIMEAQAKPQPLCPEEVAKAQEKLSVVTTLLLTPRGGNNSPKQFYAHFLMRMNTVFTNKLPTAGVSITDKVNFYINPTFFNSLDTEQQKELVEHEVEHIVYKHPVRGKDYIGGGYNSNTHKLYNISADAGINENKKALTKDFGVTFDRLNQELKKLGSKDKVGPELPSEAIYEILKRNQVEDDGSAGMQTSDDHSTWGESTDNKEVAEGIIKDLANKAQQATGVGNMPSNMLSEIEGMNKNTVNWRRELRQFFVNSLKFDFERTRTRRNRRTGLLNPGRRKKPNLHVAVCVDSSGSVGDEEFGQFFGEIGAIADMGVEITVIDADCAVAAVYKYEKKKPVKRYGRGGTNYTPAINKAKELGVDGIIYFGDGDAADTPTNPGCPFLWAIVGNSSAPGNFGRTIRVTVENGRR
jgi:predicted metal-dependent peptidase